MPVMDAFKNLIRHGKQAKETSPSAQTSPSGHHHASSSSSSTRSYPPASTTSPSAQQQQHDQRRHEEKRRAQEEAQRKEEHYRKEAQRIAEEERLQKESLPKYEGLEGFDLVEKMGDGAFSNVYKAIDRKTGLKVAVKVVRKYELNQSQNGDKHLNPNFKKRPRVTERANILKEVQIMRGTDHPSIVKLVSFSESNEHYFLVLELMEGGELFHQIVKLTYFSESLSRHVILQVAHGIRYLHEERGVVHRDIKPENILFERIPITPSSRPIHRQYDEEKEDEGEFQVGIGGGGIGRVKIADFGLSKVVWEENTATPCGTVGYTAPEIVKDERYSKSVDMWALGCVLYTLLCGFPPFYDESIAVLTEKVARGYYTFLSPWWDDISGSAKDLITHLLCVDPNQRYTIDEFLAHPWCNEQPPPLSVAPQHVEHLQPPSTAPMPLDSPLLQSMRQTGNREGRSPGVASLKEAFDITYAVHRMEEEGAHRRQYDGVEGAGARGHLGGLNEEDEEDEEAHEVAEARAKHGEAAAQTIQQRQQQKQPVVQEPPQAYQGSGGANRKQAEAALYDGRAGQRDRGTGAGGNKGRQGGFELNIGQATLLGRRTKKPSPLAQGGNNVSVTQQGTGVAVDPGSPMRF